MFGSTPLCPTINAMIRTGSLSSCADERGVVVILLSSKDPSSVGLHCFLFIELEQTWMLELLQMQNEIECQWDLVLMLVGVDALLIVLNPRVSTP
jgi:hypothetical protein